LCARDGSGDRQRCEAPAERDFCGSPLRCIITEISEDDGYYHDYMTGKVTRKAEDKEEGVAGRLAGVIFHNPSIEID